MKSSSPKRWIRGKILYYKELQVSANIVAFNEFMNSVDNFDYELLTNIIARQEIRVPMSITTYLLHALIYNTFRLLKAINPGKTIQYERNQNHKNVERLVSAFFRKQSYLQLTKVMKVIR
jgi:hypothetical protein